MFNRIEEINKVIETFNKNVNEFLLSLEKLENVSHFIIHDEVVIETREATKEEKEASNPVMGFDGNGIIYRNTGFHYDEHGEPEVRDDYTIAEREEILKDLEK